MNQLKTRWMGVGQSNSKESPDAGYEAATTALEGREAKLLIVFCSDSYDLPALLAGVNRASGSAALIGCSTAGEIASSGPGDAGVVVTALGGEGFSVKTALASRASEDLRGAGSLAASCLDMVEPLEHKVLMLLTDGLAGDQQEIVRGAYTVAGGAIPLVGGCAGDDMKMTATYQLFNDQVVSDGVIGAAIASEAPLGIGVRHGWRPVGDSFLVTRSSNNRVFSLDDQPALDVYLKLLDAPDEAYTNHAAFTRFAMTHPLGLTRRSEEPHVRFVADADFEERSLICIAEVPQGGTASFLKGDEESVLKATDGACGDALESLSSDPLGLIAFDCIARRGVLGDLGIVTEVNRISDHAKGAPVAGFYTYGEFARTRGLSGFHNQTLVVLAVG
ncbi:MAG TPA: FIST N-terminal domain-containing protein [Actinomycetota bacterium]|nr:FIST N-terminal domain-containing protein [Actinomycetota bacterium]